MKDVSRTGVEYIWKIISLDLLPQVVEDSVRMDTALTEAMEASSCVAAGDRLLVHLSRFNNYSNVLQPQKVLGFLRRSQTKWRETQLPGRRKLKHLSSKIGLCSVKIQHLAFEFQG